MDYINNQEVRVGVAVPGVLTASPEPTSTSSTAKCLYTWVEWDANSTQPGNQTWTYVGESINHTVHVSNCINRTTNLRRMVILLSSNTVPLEVPPPSPMPGPTTLI
jgi:hypothetical protein